MQTTTDHEHVQLMKIYSFFAFFSMSVPISCLRSLRMVGLDWTSLWFVKVVTTSFGTKHLSSVYNFSWTKGEATRACRFSGGGSALSSCYN